MFQNFSGVNGLQILHRYGPCSPFGQQNSSSILKKDEARFQSINSLAEGTRQPISNRVMGAGNYIVKVGIGTPARDFNLIFDTGSDLTWLKCGSNHYLPSSSSTFRNATCVSGQSCDFSVTYGDKSTASGYYINDMLTVSSEDVFPNFILGCGMKFSAEFGSADGLLGVGQGGPYSLVSQTITHFAKVFCYCLPKSDSSSGYILLGMEALETCQTATSTPLKMDPKRPSFYFVNLIGITIGGMRIEVSSPWKTIMDSGTVISRLPSPVYTSLCSEFMKFMSKSYSVAPGTELLDTCYNVGSGDVPVPKIGLEFEDVNVDLDPSALLWRKSDSVVCLAFATNDNVVDGLTIIGNHQQRTLNVLYDIQEKKVEFGVGDCSN